MKAVSKAVVALCVLATAGCTRNLDMEKVRGSVKDLITTQIGANVKSVTCPDTRPIKQGDTFDCIAEIDFGKTAVTITQKDGDGNLGLDTKQMVVKVAEVEKAIVAAVKKNSPTLDLVVDCGPKFRPSIPNDTFECTGKAGAEQAKYKVTIKDSQGNIAFETVAAASGGAAAAE
jgi:Domain of unknown function (DUF4333)